MSPTNPGLAAPEEIFFSQDAIPPPVPLDLEYLYEVFSETPPDTQPTQETTPSSPIPSQDVPDPDSQPETTAPAGGGAGDSPVCSTSTILPPPTPLPQIAAFPPLNWRRIPQKIYNYGRKQWYFTPSEPISFSVNGRLGVNMGDALRKRFTDLDGRDELVLQDTRSGISCRLSVRLS